MFELELYDRIGNKLSLGDVVKISNGREFDFYAEVKYLEEEEGITPFHTFSFHSFEKVNSLMQDNKDGSFTCLPCLNKIDDSNDIDNCMGCDW